MRTLLLPAMLTAACLAGALHTHVIHAPVLGAQTPPECSNAMCSGPSYCVWGNNHRCQFLGPDACKTERCAFVLSQT